MIRSFADMAGICNAFYLPLLKNELELLSEQDRGFGEKIWVDKLRKELVGELGLKLKNKQACLLRVGRHSGAVSVTVEGVRHIKIMQGQDTPPLHQDDTKQVWLAANSKDARGDMLPFGWVLIEPAEQTPISCIAEWFAQITQQDADKLQIIQQGLAEKRRVAAAELLMRQQHGAEQAATTARKAQEEADRAARLATLSPAMQEAEHFIAAFRQRAEQLRGDKENLNADFHGRARKLAATALESIDWTAEEKRAAADAIAEWLPKVVKGIDKDQLKKLKLSALRGLV